MFNIIKLIFMLDIIEIVIDGYMFTIRYPNGFDEYEFYKQLGEATFVFEFKPKSLMQTELSDRILSTHFPQLRADVIYLLREKESKIFDYFEMSLDPRETGSHSGYNQFGQEGTIESHIIMKWPTKKELN